MKRRLLVTTTFEGGCDSDYEPGRAPGVNNFRASCTLCTCCWLALGQSAWALTLPTAHLPPFSTPAPFQNQLLFLSFTRIGKQLDLHRPRGNKAPKGGNPCNLLTKLCNQNRNKSIDGYYNRCVYTLERFHILIQLRMASTIAQRPNHTPHNK